MPRRYYRSRRILPRVKWSINSTNILGTAPSCAATKVSAVQLDIVASQSRTRSTGDPNNVSAAILKAGRIRFKGVISSSMSAGQSALVFIAYLPELITGSFSDLNYASIGTTVFYSHPEWVMAWTRVDYTNAAQKNEVSLYTRLKRNLNPGDRIALIVTNINPTANAVSQIDVIGTATYVVKNN